MTWQPQDKLRARALGIRLEGDLPETTLRPQPSDLRLAQAMLEHPDFAADVRKAEQAQKLHDGMMRLVWGLALWGCVGWAVLIWQAAGWVISKVFGG